MELAPTLQLTLIGDMPPIFNPPDADFMIILLVNT